MNSATSAPGMQAALAILTARLESMGGDLTTEEYVMLLQQELRDEDHTILTSAMASLSAAILAIASTSSGMSQRKLLQTIGMTLAVGNGAA